MYLFSFLRPVYKAQGGILHARPEYLQYGDNTNSLNLQFLPLGKDVVQCCLLLKGHKQLPCIKFCSIFLIEGYSIGPILWKCKQPQETNMISQVILWFYEVPQTQARFLSSNIICLWVKSSQIVSMTFIAKKKRHCLENDTSHLSSTLHYSMVLP